MTALQIGQLCFLFGLIIGFLIGETKFEKG